MSQSFENGYSDEGETAVIEAGNFFFSPDFPHPTEQHLMNELTFHFDAHNAMSCYDSQAEEEAAAEAGPIGESLGQGQPIRHGLEGIRHL